MGSVIVNPTPRGVVALIPEDLDVNTGAAKSATIDSLAFVQNSYRGLLARNEALLDSLVDLGKNFDVPDIDTAISKVSVTPVTYPSARSWSEIVLKKAGINELPLKPSIDDFGDLDFSFIEPVPPSEFNASFNWVGTAYSSDTRTALAAAIYNELANGRYGLPSNVHSALIEKEQNARLRNQASQVREALNATGNSGFVLGMGSPAQRGIIAEATKAQVYADQDSLNAITAIDFETYQRNKEFFHSLALELDKMKSGEWNLSEQRSFEAGRAEFEFLLRAREVSLEVYIKRWDGIKIKSESLQARVTAIATKNKSKTDQYVAEYDAYKTRVEAVGAENASKVQIRGMEIGTWAKEVDAVAQKDSSLLARASFKYQQIRDEVDNILKVHGVNTDGYKAEADLKAAVTEGAARVSAQTTSSTIGAMSVSSSLGFSGSEGVRRSLSESVHMGESYSASLTEGT